MSPSRCKSCGHIRVIDDGESLFCGICSKDQVDYLLPVRPKLAPDVMEYILTNPPRELNLRRVSMVAVSSCQPFLNENGFWPGAANAALDIPNLHDTCIVILGILAGVLAGKELGKISQVPFLIQRLWTAMRVHHPKAFYFA